MHLSEDGTPSAMLFKCKSAYGMRTSDIIPDDEEEKFEPMQVLQRFLKNRLARTTGDNYEGIGRRSDARLALNDFYYSEARFENSLKFLPIWAEAFVITALAWTFAPVLSKKARSTLSERLKERIIGCKSDFGTYQKAKKKAVASNALAKEKSEEITHKAMQRQSSVSDAQMLTGIGKNRQLIR